MSFEPRIKNIIPAVGSAGFFDNLFISVSSVTTSYNYIPPGTLIMKHHHGRCVSALMLLCSVITPAFATVISTDIFKKSPEIHWRRTSTAMRLNTNNDQSTNTSSVYFFYNFLSERTLSITSPAINSYTAFLSITADAFMSNLGLTTDETYQLDSLWSPHTIYDDATHDKINFTKTNLYFEAPVYELESLNFRMWKSLGVRQVMWDGLFNQSLNSASNEPEPTPMGALGIGMVSFASLKRRSQHKRA